MFQEHEQPRLVAAKAWHQEKERHESKEMAGSQMVPEGIEPQAREPEFIL